MLFRYLKFWLMDLFGIRPKVAVSEVEMYWLDDGVDDGKAAEPLQCVYSDDSVKSVVAASVPVGWGNGVSGPVVLYLEIESDRRVMLARLGLPAVEVLLVPVGDDEESRMRANCLAHFCDELKATFAAEHGCRLLSVKIVTLAEILSLSQKPSESCDP